ncbi:hypothetical protein [Mycobacterium kansasii]|uniref:hypothetical protein n=1 Tax=Mycobacterium kansasii TaxID=1768 RepID=UPI0021560EFE|nr:hypothetical protein [Mycobacterium kansasii]
MLDFDKRLHITLSEQRNRHTALSSASGPTDPVNISLGIMRHIVVKYMGNAFNVKTA